MFILLLHFFFSNFLPRSGGLLKRLKVREFGGGTVKNNKICFELKICSKTIKTFKVGCEKLVLLSFKLQPHRDP